MTVRNQHTPATRTLPAPVTTRAQSALGPIQPRVCAAVATLLVGAGTEEGRRPR